MNIHLLPGNNSFFTNVEKFLKSDVKVMFDFLCQQLHHVYSLTHISNSKRWPVSDIRRISNNYVLLLAFAPSSRTNEIEHDKEKIELFHMNVAMHGSNTKELRNLFERLYNFSEFLKENQMNEKMQYDLHKDKADNVDSLPIYCMLDDMKLSDRNTLAILEEELMICMKLATDYPSKYGKKMQNKVKCLLLQHVYTTPRGSENKTPRVYDINNPYIQLLSEAIKIMEKISGEMTKLTRENLIAHHLCLAYCLHALCIRECDFFDVDCGDFILDKSIMSLLQSLFDFLQLKGFNAKDVYLLLNKMYNLKKYSIGKQLTLLWESRRLNHPLCVLPVDKDSIKSLSYNSGQVPNTESWMHWSASIGFQQNFSFLFSNFDNNSEDHGKSFPREISVCEICKTANELILMNNSISTFHAGYLYLDLCERLVANGRLAEVTEIIALT